MLRSLRWQISVGLAGLLAMGPAATAQVFSPSSAQTVTLRGKVLGSDGAPIRGAEVLVEGMPRRAVTQDDGSYTLQGVPVGTVRLMARRLGYVPTRMDFEVTPGNPRLDWRLPPMAAQLAAFRVTERREPFDARLEGFRSRSERRQGGHYVTRDRIEQSANRRTLDLIATIPGVRLTTPTRGSGISVRLRSARCPPLVFVDGFPASAGEFDLESIDLYVIEGIEVYLSSSTVPAEFMGPRGLEQCGVIAFWSRPAQLRAERPRLRPAALAFSDSVRAAAYSADAVDEPAAIFAAEPEVTYPDSLWRAGVAGGATVDFVVDERGLINWATVREVSATHPAFMNAVLASLRTSQWSAARRGGRPVSQVVVFSVAFSRPAEGP